MTTVQMKSLMTRPVGRKSISNTTNRRNLLTRAVGAKKRYIELLLWQFGLIGIKCFLFQDVKLKLYVEEYNEKWSMIAEHFPDRSDVQCQQRWTKVVNPELIKGPWTKEVTIIASEPKLTQPLLERVFFILTNRKLIGRCRLFNPGYYMVIICSSNQSFYDNTGPDGIRLKRTRSVVYAALICSLLPPTRMGRHQCWAPNQV